jgi:hypothetical protein
MAELLDVILLQHAPGSRKLFRLFSEDMVHEIRISYSKNIQQLFPQQADMFVSHGTPRKKSFQNKYKIQQYSVKEKGKRKKEEREGKNRKTHKNAQPQTRYEVHPRGAPSLLSLLGLFVSI